MSGILTAQSSWKLAKDQDGIQVYTKEKPGSVLKMSKVTGEVESSLSTLVAIFQDVDAYDAFFPSTSEMRLLERPSETKQIHYLVSDAPWPVADRDGIYEYVFSYASSEKTVYIQMHSLPDYLGQEEDRVRIRECTGTWTLKQLSTKKTLVTYEFHVEPGGSVPAWLANMSVTDTPYETLANLRKRAALNQYQGKSFSFIR